MKTYLVTGGAGFIGSNFINYMLKKYNNIKIINLDLLTYAGNLKNLQEVEKNKGYKFVQGDISDKELILQLFDKYNFDYVVNFAAESHVDRSIIDPTKFMDTNIMGTVNLLNCCKENWCTNDVWQEGVKYIQISTDEVYGSLGREGYFTEETLINPHSPYSSSKASADLIVKSYFDTYDMPINITRCSNNYGAYQFPEKLIPLLIENYLKYNKLHIYRDGSNIRDWLYVEDHCKAIDMVISDGKYGEVYNIGGHNEKTNLEIVDLVIEYLNKEVDSKITKDLKVFVKDRKGHDKRYAINPTKIKEELNWEPDTRFEVGIIKTIKWYLSNKEWLNSVTSGDRKSVV